MLLNRRVPVIETLISSKTRIKLLLKFFLNSDARSYLRGLEAEFGESTNAIRQELNRFEKAGMLRSYAEGNRKYFQANTDHPLFTEIHNLLIKYIGFDTIIDTIAERLGGIRDVYLIGAFSNGTDSPVVDLVFTGDINEEYLVHLVRKAESMIRREIRYTICAPDDVHAIGVGEAGPKPILLWSREA